MVSLKKVAKMSHMSTERDGTGWDLRPGGMGFFFSFTTVNQTVR